MWFVIYPLCKGFVPDDAADVVADAGLALCGERRGVGELAAGIRVVRHGKPVILNFKPRALKSIVFVLPLGPLPHVARQRYLIPPALPPGHVAHRILKERK